MLDTSTTLQHTSILDELAEKKDGGQSIDRNSIIEAFARAAAEGHQIHRPGAVARLLDRRVLSAQDLEMVRELALEAAHAVYRLIGNGLYRQIQNPQHFVQTLLYHELAAKAQRLQSVE